MDKTEAKLADNKRRYREFIDELILRLGGKCRHCGAAENLEFDHIDWRTKVFSVTTNWYIIDRDLFESELAKCQLLCNSCHKIKTAVDITEQRGDQFRHGTVYAWMKRKCDCLKCCEAKRDWNDERNAKRRLGEGAGLYRLPAEHGTYKSYKRGCKCDPCKAANATRARELAAEKRSLKEQAVLVDNSVGIN